MTDIGLTALAEDPAEERRRARLARARKAKLVQAFKHIVLPVLTALAVLLAWDAAVDLNGIPKVILPAPSDIAETTHASTAGLLLDLPRVYPGLFR